MSGVERALSQLSRSFSRKSIKDLTAATTPAK
jgi:hypothetical protein